MVIALFLLMVGVGCKEEPSVSDIYHTWKFQGFGNVSTGSFEKADAGTPAFERNYMLTFEKDGKFSGYTTTNGISGEYIINGKSLQLKDIFGTKIAERGNGYKYANALPVIESYEIAKNKLKLYYNQGQQYLLYNLSN